MADEQPTATTAETTPDVIEEVMPVGTYIGLKRLRELRAEGYVLAALVDARDFGANESEDGMYHYVFYKVEK